MYSGEGNVIQYGATLDEWVKFDIELGLTEDLLPVVANPHAKISPTSRMKDKGKVPSIYTRKKEVVGVSNWTNRRTDCADVERWYQQPDYGICIQTRNVRAFDIDIPDKGVVEEVKKVIIDTLGFELPLRHRENSSKCLLAFKLEGSHAKRVIKTKEKVKSIGGELIEPAWLIEFLATGQQFIAAGTHPSGARINWDWRGIGYFPEVTLDQFEDVWQMLTLLFACASPTQGALRRKGESYSTEDLTVRAILEKNLCIDTGKDGQLFIDCPWKDDHSMDSGITQTAYFPRGTGGYDLGHFKCLHAGCSDKTDTDFEDALGLNEDMFEVVEDETLPARVKMRDLPNFERNKHGEIEATLHNLGLALAHPDVCNCVLRFDEFRDEDMIIHPGKQARPMTDGDSVKLRKHLERNGFKPIGRELMRDAITAHGEDHRIDTAIEWVNGLKEWDGIPRVDSFLHIYFNADNTDYTTAASRYLWTALAGRCLSPGIKADMALILQGEQGVIKSTAISALVPHEDLFTELSLGDPEDTLARRMRGKLVVELGELRGFYSREFESIKAWIVRRTDQWVPKYKERATTFARRCIFIGTTNHIEFLVDETGNRRFLPVCVRRADIKAIVRDRLQLWAEARTIFLKDGVQWSAAEKLAKKEHAKFSVHDSWEDDITSWLHLPDIDDVRPVDRPWLRTSQVLREALNIDARNSNSTAEKRVAKVLKVLGYERKSIRLDGRTTKVFVRKDEQNG